MGLLITFKTIYSVDITQDVIMNVVKNIGGKAKRVSDGRIEAQWRSKRFLTVMPVKFNFYVGIDMVRVAVGSKTATAKTDVIALVEYKPGGVLRVWEEFIIELEKLYPNKEFGLRSGIAKLDCVRLLSDGIEQVYYTSTYTRDVGFLIPGSISRSVTTAKSQIADQVLAQVRYTNGMTEEGPINKKSELYQTIATNMSVLG